MSSDEKERSYIGIVLVAIIAGSLVALDTFGVNREPFQLVENRYPQSFSQITSGEQKAFTAGGIVRKQTVLLEFRFSYLVKSRAPIGVVEDPNATNVYMTEIIPLLSLSDMWDQSPEIITTSLELDDGEYELVIYDFTKLLNATGNLKEHNETLTTYGIVYGDSGEVSCYYKGVSGFVFQNRTNARVVHLSLGVDEEKEEFYDYGMASAYETPSLADGPKLGLVNFRNPSKGSSYRVTFTLEAAEEMDMPSLQIVRVYMDRELQVCLANGIGCENLESEE
jgi:hypothetical protein